MTVGRKDERKKKGPYRRHIRATTASEDKGSSKRKMFPGIEINKLSYGVTENVDSNYTIEEEKLFQVNADVKNLITLLESKDEA